MTVCGGNSSSRTSAWYNILSITGGLSLKSVTLIMKNITLLKLGRSESEASIHTSYCWVVSKSNPPLSIVTSPVLESIFNASLRFPPAIAYLMLPTAPFFGEVAVTLVTTFPCGTSSESSNCVSELYENVGNKWAGLKTIVNSHFADFGS